MTALSRAKPNVLALEAFGLQLRGMVVDSGAQLYQGSAMGRDPSDSGNVKALAAGKPFYRAIGVSSVDMLGDGIAHAIGSVGLFEFENSSSGDAIAATLPLGWPLYDADDNTAALTDGSGTRAKLGVFGGWSNNGKPLVWVGCDPYAIGVIKWPIVFGFAEAAAGGAALTVDLNFGPVLPGPCRVVGYSCDELTVFSGGSVATATFKLGISTDNDAIHTALDIFTGATAAPKKGTAGVLGYNCAPLAAGAQIMGTVTTTTANVNALTAGAFVGSLILQPGS